MHCAPCCWHCYRCGAHIRFGGEESHLLEAHGIKKAEEPVPAEGNFNPGIQNALEDCYLGDDGEMPAGLTEHDDEE
jgi:hypothetical protein